MPGIRTGSITAFYMYDVAEAIQLPDVATLVGGTSVPARLAPKPATPASVQYLQPPIVVDGAAVGVAEIDGFRARFKVFDYGVVSLALTRPFSGSWDDLIAASQRWMANVALEHAAEAACRRLLDRMARATHGAHATLVTEDYLVLTVTALDTPLSGDELLAAHGDQIARAVRGESQALSAQEREDVLRNRISYYANDLIVPTWNVAFLYDTEAGEPAAIEIIEFANSQLLEFRYYDQLLDTELSRIYGTLQARPRWLEIWRGRRYTRAARQVHTLFIDVNEVTDRAENALKFIGDVYAARVYVMVGTRLGLNQWKANVHEKLKTLDDIYRFAVEQTSMERGEFLELAIVLILVLELVLFFMGVMK